MFLLLLFLPLVLSDAKCTMKICAKYKETIVARKQFKKIK